MAEFIALLAAEPPGYSAVGAQLLAAGADLGTAADTLAQQTANLSTSWTGDAADAQRRHAQQAERRLREIALVLRDAARVCEQGGAQLTAATAQLRSFVDSMFTDGFVVLPTAVVIPGPAHYAQAAAAGPLAPEVLGQYEVAAEMLTTALQAQVGEASALDDEVAAQLRGVTGRLADIMPGVAPVTASVPGLTAAQIEHEQGILVRNQRKFQALADADGLTVDVRPTNQDSVPWLHLGGIPKPPAIKAKTISGLDVQLGADERFKGAVGFFQPVLPPRGSMSDADWNRLVARYQQRMDEQAELGPKMASLATHKVGEDRFEVHEGVVYGYDSGGVLRPVTGDHDMFNIRRQDGSQLSGGEYTNLVNELVRRDMGVQHGAHMYWQPDTDWERTNVYEPIVQQHMPGGKEQLVRFAPGQPPSLVWGDAGV